MKKGGVIFLLIIFTLLSCGGTGGDSKNTGSGSNTGSPSNIENPVNQQYSVPKNYWGAWYNVHTGKKVFFDAETEFKEFKPLSDTLVFADGNYYIRASLADTKVIGKVVVQSLQTMGISNIGDVNAILQRIREDGKKDRNIRQERKPDEKGNVEFEVPGGSNYLFTGKDDKGNVCETKVYVEGDSVEIGNCILRPEGDYNLKAGIIVYSRDTDAGFLYGDLYTYDYFRNAIRIKNIGDRAVTAVTVKVDTDSPYVDMLEYYCDIEDKWLPKGTECVIGSIEPGEYKDLRLRIRFKFLNNWEEKVKINITMVDPIFNRTFEDYVYLNVYKRPINFNFKADGRLNGYLALKGRKVVRVQNGLLRIPFLPNQVYYLYLSNPQGNEVKYSFGIDAPVQSLDNFTSEDIKRFEPNDVESQAPVIRVGDSVRAFLHASSESIDMDIFKIVMREEDLNTKSAVDLKFAEYGIYDDYEDYCSFYIDLDGDGNYTDNVCSKGNNNGILNPGEIAIMQVAIKNIGSSEAYNVSVDLHSDDKYVKVYRVADYSGNPRSNVIDVIGSGEVKDSSGAKKGVSSWYLSYVRSNGQFLIIVDKNVPVPYKTNLKLTIKDGFGNVWYDTVPIEVKPVDAKLTVYDISDFYDSCCNSAYIDINGDGHEEYVSTDGNGDGILNPGETASLNVAVKNEGTERTIDVRIIPYTNDQYVKVYDEGIFIQMLDLGEVKDTNGYDYNSFFYSSYGKIFIIVDPNTPSGHTATIYLDIVDLYGNKTTKTVEVTVQ